MKRFLAALCLLTALTLVGCQSDDGTSTDQNSNPSTNGRTIQPSTISTGSETSGSVDIGSSDAVTALEARFAISPNDGSGTTSTNFKFNGSNSEGSISKYTWNFGDGSSATGSVVYHKFSKNGNYTVRLTVEASGGAKDSIDKSVPVGGSGGGGGGGGEGTKCTNKRPPRDTRFFRVVSHDKAKKTIIAKFEKAQTCATAFTLCADVRIGGLTPSQKEYWIGTVCEMWDLGNNTFRIHLVDGRYWVTNGDRAYVWAQYDCNPHTVCRAFGY